MGTGNVVQTIAQSLHAFLAAQTRGTTRRFFRLDGFDDAVYAALLERFRAEGDTLADRPLWVRTTAPLSGYESYALEADKSATWYRNHVPSGSALVLIFNQPTSDAQSLKDVYPVTESLLATEGLECLIQAAFTTYQPSPEQVRVLCEFLARLRPSPQLRDLAEFLHDLDNYLNTHPGEAIERAIAESLPALGLFRCRELADVLNTAKGETLLRHIGRAARLGRELLDDAQRDEYLARLERAEFDDDSSFGGLTPEEKRALLRRFVADALTDRRELLEVLRLDWREVAPVLHKSPRRSQPDQLKDLAATLREILEAQNIVPQTLPEPVQDMLADLTAGEEPEETAIEAFLTQYGDSLPRRIQNQLRRLTGARRHQTADFLAGLTSLGVELLTTAGDNLPPGVTLTVRWKPSEIKPGDSEALRAFRALYGGIESVLPFVRWELDELWAQVSEQETAPEAEEEGEREKVIKTDLAFQITLSDTSDEGNVLARAELVWRYRSDSPAAATLAHLEAEAQLLAEQQADGPLFQNIVPRLRIPIYNTCPSSNEVSDLDLSRPFASLGAWYRDATNLGDELRKSLQRAARKETLAAIDTALTRLEEAWANFVKGASEQGLLAADLDGLLSAYEALLLTAADHLQQGQEILHGARWLVQAWMVGPAAFDEWAVMPLLHPLKLQWYRARARRFADFLGACLSSEPAPVVDIRRFRQELTVTYSSAGYPALIALPGKDRRPVYFLPVHEIQGYELFRREDQAGLAYGLDPELVSEDESEEAAEVAATELARVIQDYLETYPFARDGLELYILECRNGALPGLLVERLNKLARRRKWNLRLTVVVHSTDRGAPLYRRSTEWLRAQEELTDRPEDDYFPLVSLRVLECPYDEFFQQARSADLVILPDVLAEKGQEVESEIGTVFPVPDVRDEGLFHRPQQAPFERGELYRRLLLTPESQPRLLQQFYRLQWTAREQKPLSADQIPRFFQRVSLLDWEQLLTELHRRFNWVVCYDTTVDRFLLEATLPGAIEVIRYSLGLGIKRRHNLTVSSSYRAKDIVVSRLAANLESLLPGTPDEFRREVAQRLVAEAKQVSGDIVLRAAGPGAYLNELIGLVIAKRETERRYLEHHPGALTAWIYLDDFAHWFDGRIPDLLFVAIPPEADGELPLHIELLETKCVGAVNFALEAADAQKQVAQGINRLAQAWAPGARHLDAPYWYDQLYRAVVGNLALERDHLRLWEAFLRRLPGGNFTLEMSGHTWVFCHDSSLNIPPSGDEGNATAAAPDARDVPHRYHYFGRTGLRRLLRSLVEKEWKLSAPPETWSAVHDAPPSPPVPQVPPAPPPTVPVTAGISAPPAPPAPEAEETPSPQPLAEWREQQARNLARALRDYGVQVYPIRPEDADVGPGVVRFKVRLRPGEKLGRLQAIAADLQRELALNAPPLIDNVRGTNFVGIDLPHPQPEILPLLPALAELPPAQVGRLPFLVGKTPAGKTVTADLADLPHLLVAGSTGSGKTIFLYGLMVSLLHNHGPEALSVLLIDPKQTDFVYFEGLPHLLGGQVVIEPRAAIAWLDQLTTETLSERSQHLRAARCRDIHDYNARHPGAPLAPIVVVIDEYADLIQVLDRSERQEFEQRLVRLAQRARNVGIHLVIATQRPSADVVTSNLKANLPARIAFRLPSHHDSMTILDQAGAENLLGKGDMLFRSGEGIERLQGFYISPTELMEPLSRWYKPD